MNPSVILESRYLSVRGRSIHYVASTLPVDPRPPVVLVHGVGLSHRYLLPLAVRLAKDFQVYVPDLPGFGLSFKPDRVLSVAELADWLAEWIAEIPLSRPAMLGNSVGCQYIVALAVRHPECVSRAVLQGPTCDPQARTFPRQLGRWALNRMREHLSGLDTIPVRGPGPQIRHVEPATSQDYRECGRATVIKAFFRALEHPIAQQLPQMQCPTLVVRGSKDLIVPQRWAEEATRLLPDGRLIVIPGGTHTINLESPLELHRVTRPFFEVERRKLITESATGGKTRRRGQDSAGDWADSRAERGVSP